MKTAHKITALVVLSLVRLKWPVDCNAGINGRTNREITPESTDFLKGPPVVP